jgi:hypothetical protein
LSKKYSNNYIQTYLVISAFHGNLDWVNYFIKKTKGIKKIFIYVKNYNNLENINKLRIRHKKIFFLYVKNVGINMYDINHFIYNNYNHLPEKIIFLKSNSFSRTPRHCDLNEVISIANQNINLASLEIKTTVKLPITYYNYDNGFLELNNNWYSKKKIKRKYFHEFDQFMNFYFKNYSHWKFLRFPPGGNMIVSRKHILKYPRYLYKNFFKICSHDSWPLEALFLERGLFSIFSSDLKVKNNKEISLNKVKLKKINYIRFFTWKCYTLILRIAEFFRPK